MKYAIISDIHGNHPALSAVLADAKKVKVDKYIFAGDYCLCLPFPNEVADTIKNMDNSYIVRGNHEDYFDNLTKQDQNTWTDGQNSVLYWCYKTMTKDNIEYLANLPKEIKIPIYDTTINIIHSSKLHFGKTNLDEFTSKNYAINYRKDSFTHEEYLGYVNDTLNNDINLGKVLSDISDGIYIFGHAHVQWHMQIKKKLLINPGSCGLPLDCTSGAPYTIVEITNNNWIVEERRVKYDIEATIDNLRKSELYMQAKTWSNLVIDVLRTGQENVQFFFEFINNYANQINDSVRPYSKETWDKAYEIWHN